jgi:hypothetical protein
MTKIKETLKSLKNKIKDNMFHIVDSSKYILLIFIILSKTLITNAIWVDHTMLLMFFGCFMYTTYKMIYAKSQDIDTTSTKAYYAEFRLELESDHRSLVKEHIVFFLSSIAAVLVVTGKINYMFVPLHLIYIESYVVLFRSIHAQNERKKVLTELNTLDTKSTRFNARFLTLLVRYKRVQMPKKY